MRSRNRNAVSVSCWIGGSSCAVDPEEPGVTPAFVAAIQAQDVYVIMGLLTLSVLLLMVGDLIAYFLLVVVDSRIRYA